MEFSNKLIVLTGVGRAGQAGEIIAQTFAERGATLALIAHSQSEADARAAALTAAGYTASSHAANLADAATAAAASVLSTHSAFSSVHAVICAAGGFGATGPLDASDPSAWHKQFSINLDTAYCTTRAFLPAVRKARGSFVYFVSAAALPGGKTVGLAAYTAAKSGVIALLRTVAADEVANGVRANAVAPTAIRTATNLADMSDKTKYVDRESVADVVAFLASNAARNVSGQVLMLS